MSIDRCNRCWECIDTDFDSECYIETKYDTKCLCASCREKEEDWNDLGDAMASKHEDQQTEIK